MVNFTPFGFDFDEAFNHSNMIAVVDSSIDEALADLPLTSFKLSV